MKHKYEEMNPTLQNILGILGNVNRSSKTEIAKQLIQKGIYKP